MGLDCGHLKVVFEERPGGTLYKFWKYFTKQFMGVSVKGFGEVVTYTEEELRDYAQEFGISPEINEWISGLFAKGNKYVNLVWNRHTCHPGGPKGPRQ